MTDIRPGDRLVVALDVPTTEDAVGIVGELKDVVNFYKIGWQLVPVGGFELARWLVEDGHKVFLDLKLHDIGQIVGGAVRNILDVGATFVTVHAEEEAVACAVEAAEGTDLKILAVTVLTSSDQHNLTQIGYPHSVEELVLRRARVALNAGAHGVVASAREAAALRRALGRDFIILTPGIRSAGAAVHDQKRVVTPGDAIRAGADYLVAGREITQAADKKAAAENILAQIEAALVNPVGR